MPSSADDGIAAVTDWTVGATSPGRFASPHDLADIVWFEARAPGTVAGALRDAGEWQPDTTRDLDAEDWWFRANVAAAPAADGEEVALRLDGIATIADVFLDGEPIARSTSMFASHAIDVGSRLHDGAQLAICCRALAPVIAESRPPRARWRTKLAAGGLRHVRTMLLGRAPGMAPSPAAVGPWRPVQIERRRHAAIDDLRVRARVHGDDGRVTIAATVRSIGGATIRSVTVTVDGPTPGASSALSLEPSAAGFTCRGELVVRGAARWWPHTHGDPALYRVRLRVETDGGDVEVDAGHVGFRTLEPGPPGHVVESDGLDLRVNGVRVFARGAVWTPVDIVSLSAPEHELHRRLLQVRDAGMNMVRIPGTSAYEVPAFHDLCDELGILVWQDLMFANFDYPIADDAFRAVVETEATTVLADLGSRPSLAVVCGNSEVEQQATMVGRSPDDARGELFGELIPALVRAADVDAPYVPSAPFGGELPFRPGRGIANYYGVGGYLRPLSDARLAGTRFAAECLALSNLPDDDAVAVADAGVPRDAGAEWDFADVREHYVGVLFGVDVAALRASAPNRLLELGRATSGELMAHVFGEWRRRDSKCGGGLVLWLGDLEPGAGWGILDHRGDPKVAYHHLRRALAPVAVWFSDEGLNGLDVHVANDRPDRLTAQLRVAFYRDGETLVEEVRTPLDVEPHAVERYGAEALLGRFIDASYAYRFGPPSFDVAVATIERDERDDPIAQGFAYPAGRQSSIEPSERIGLCASATRDANDVLVTVSSTRLATGVRLQIPGFAPDDDAFSIEPGRTRTVRCRATGATAPSAGRVRALNLDGEIPLVIGAGS